MRCWCSSEGETGEGVWWADYRPEGSGYADCLDLVDELIERCSVIGLILAEYIPKHDNSHRAFALTAARVYAVESGQMRGL